MAEIVVGLYPSRGVAEDAVNRLRTEGVPDGDVFLKMLSEVALAPGSTTVEFTAFDPDPVLWSNVRNTYGRYIRNGETVVLVRAETAAEIELASNVLRIFEPLVVELLTVEFAGQTTPAPRNRTTSSGV
ncbi:MAG TPA: hypothetical protein VND87_14290 [Stellaceae bacterium]|nr:hypothetical protein [Stellaceae bacterium]